MDEPKSAWREVTQAGLQRAIFALTAFVLAAVGIWATRVPLPYQLVAALGAIVAAALGLRWLAEPWSHWTRDKAWRLLSAGGAIGIAVGVLLLGWILSRSTDRPPSLASHASLVLLDTSSGMADQLDSGDTKWTASVETLEDRLVAPAGFQTGLATFGGSCDAPAHLEVAIGPDHADDIAQSTASERELAGERNLVRAATWAVRSMGDFTGSRQMIIISSGLDDCGALLADLEAEAAALGAAVRLDLIGLGWSESQQREFESVRPPTVEVRFVADSDELNTALDASLTAGARMNDITQLGSAACRGEDADLSNEDLRGAALRGVDCSEGNFSFAVLAGADFRGADLTGANLVGADLSGANLDGADLTNARLDSAIVDNVSWNDATLTDSFMRNADLREVDLTGVDLASVDLNGADLSGRDFSGADLSNYKLLFAVLAGADFRGADLTGANLVGADLSGANLDGADLTNARLDSAIVDNVSWNDATTWPEGSSPPS